MYVLYLYANKINKYNMFITSDRNSLLKGYDQDQYSPAFQKLINRVVGRIFRHRNQKIKVVTEPDYKGNEHLVWSRKNSLAVPHIKYPVSLGKIYPSSKTCTTKPFEQKLEKNRTPKARSTEMISTSKCRLSTRNATNSNIQTDNNFYKKISEYNQCLMTKTFQSQQNQPNISNIAEEIRTTNSRAQHNFSRIKNGENNRKQNYLIKCKNRIKENGNNYRSIQRDNSDFKPWQTETPQDIFC